MAINKTKIKKGVRMASYGVAGNIAGTAIGFQKGNHKLGSRIGTAAGLAVGGAIESRKSVPSSAKTTGTKKFGRRVGTKTQGRVGKSTRPFDTKPKTNTGGADAAAD